MQRHNSGVAKRGCHRGKWSARSGSPQSGTAGPTGM